jgi:hypothetical protein
MAHEKNLLSLITLIANEITKPVLNYHEAKLQAQKIDKLLKYDCLKIENNLRLNKNTISAEEKELWLGLDLQSLQTPYSEIFQMIQIIKPAENQKWIDLGAAYGRIGLVLGLLNPNIQFIGYEYIQERTDEANRIYQLWKIQQAQIITADISSSEFILENADVYFIYDFGSQKDIYIILEKLRVIAQTQPIQLIARGRGIKNWILYDFPWLHLVKPPQYFENWTLFQS